jgi:hypothetical protein
MPLIGELPTNGLKFWVMLVSGEDSITRAGALEAEAGEVELEPAAGELPEAEGEDELDEQAARPAARRPVAASATALLLVILLVDNFDLSFRG